MDSDLLNKPDNWQKLSSEEQQQLQKQIDAILASRVPRSFSKTTWKSIALSQKWHTTSEDHMDSLDPLHLPRVVLPVSFLDKALSRAAPVLQLYGLPRASVQEEAKNRLLAPFLSTCTELFAECFHDSPEKTIAGGELSTGGRVEYQLYFQGGTLLSVIEMKVSFASSQLDAIAQVLAEIEGRSAISTVGNRAIYISIEAVHSLNKINHVASSYATYGILTDLGQTAVFRVCDKGDRVSFAGTPFFIRIEQVPSASQYFAYMHRVSEIIVATLLQALIDYLEAVRDVSKKRTDTSAVPSHQWTGETELDNRTENSDAHDPKRAKLDPLRQSTSAWESALELAKKAQKLLGELETSEEGLKTLQKCTDLLPYNRKLDLTASSEDILQQADTKYSAQMMNGVYKYNRSDRYTFRRC